MLELFGTYYDNMHEQYKMNRTTYFAVLFPSQLTPQIIAQNGREEPPDHESFLTHYTGGQTYWKMKHN
jgi:hypothetical protein